MWSRRKRWSDLSRRQRVAIVAAATVQITVQAAALLDIRRRDAAAVRGNRGLWAAATFVKFLGPVAYFVFGRRPD